MALGRKTGGRVKGTPNKLTTSAREAFEEAFEKMGGSEALFRWGSSEPTEFYKLYAKIIPVRNEHTGADGSPIQVITHVPPLEKP